MRGEQRPAEPSYRMLTEISRNVADFQPPSCRAVIGIGTRPLDHTAVPYVPFLMSGEKLLGRKSLIVGQAKQQIVMCRNKVRLEGQRALKLRHRLIQFAKSLKSSAKVV